MEQLRRLGTVDDTSFNAVTTNLDQWYYVWGGICVFFMQAGFCMLECGSVRSKNARNICIKNLLDACIATICWWSFGYAVAFGGENDTHGDSNEFIGHTGFFLEGGGQNPDGVNYAQFFFQWAFAATAASIVSGAVAERCQMTAYFIYCIVLTSFVYPVVVHWAWSYKGWLSPWRNDYSTNQAYFDTGVIDFAGSGVVHLTGGVAAFVGAAFLGPRSGRFYDKDGVMMIKEMPPHNSALQVLGTFILWLGWYAFNGASTLAITPAGYGVLLARVVVTTTLSASSCAITCVAIKAMETGGEYDLGYAMNGVLAGLVSITGPCAVVEPWAAVCIGFIGAFVYVFGSKLALWMQIDDVVDAIAVHGWCGTWGVLASGVFASPKLVSAVYGFTGEFRKGFVYGGNGNILGVAAVFVICILLWVGGLMSITFGSMSAAGILRVSQQEEEDGLDLSHHGGSAYNDDKKKSSEMAFSWFS